MSYNFVFSFKRLESPPAHTFSQLFTFTTKSCILMWIIILSKCAFCRDARGEFYERPHDGQMGSPTRTADLHPTPHTGVGHDRGGSEPRHRPNRQNHGRTGCGPLRGAGTGRYLPSQTTYSFQCKYLLNTKLNKWFSSPCAPARTHISWWACLRLQVTSVGHGHRARWKTSHLGLVYAQELLDHFLLQHFFFWQMYGDFWIALKNKKTWDNNIKMNHK